MGFEDEGNDGEQTNSFSFAPSLVRSIHISKDFLVFVNHSFHASSIIVCQDEGPLGGAM